MGGDYRGDGDGGTRPPQKNWGRKANRPPIIAPFSIFFHFDYGISIIVFPFKFPNAYINLYVPLSPSDLAVTVVACFYSFFAHRYRSR